MVRLKNHFFCLTASKTASKNPGRKTEGKKTKLCFGFIIKTKVKTKVYCFLGLIMAVPYGFRVCFQGLVFEAIGGQKNGNPKKRTLKTNPKKL